MDCDVLLSAENALVDLRRDIARDFQRERREKVVVRFQFPVHAPGFAWLGGAASPQTPRR